MLISSNHIECLQQEVVSYGAYNMYMVGLKAHILSHGFHLFSH